MLSVQKTVLNVGVMYLTGKRATFHHIIRAFKTVSQGILEEKTTSSDLSIITSSLVLIIGPKPN